MINHRPRARHASVRTREVKAGRGSGCTGRDHHVRMHGVAVVYIAEC